MVNFFNTFTKSWFMDAIRSYRESIRRS